MNYEEKYKEAIKRAKAMIKVAEKEEEVYKSAITIFPELEESEDERIRKWLIDTIKAVPNDSIEWEKIDKSDVLAWLKKQGEKSEYNPYKATVESIAEMCKSYSTSTDLHDFYDNVRVKCKDAMEYDKTWTEKQGEQKPIFDFKAKDWYVSKVDGKIRNIYHSVDEVEPKFKVGDWITNGEHTWKVTDIKPLDYILQSQNGDTVDDTISYVDEEFHLWTIQDAKDGDVLSQDSIPFIFKSWDNNCIAYCGITGFGLFKVVEDYFSWCNGINVTPATKEQRDLLFQKMHEDGYEWDDEKKELKRIEQGCYHSDGLYYAIDILEKTFGKVEGYQSDDGKMEHQTAIETVNALYHKKPAEWSEEDEKLYTSALWHIKNSCGNGGKDSGEYEVYNWLKSIKDRIQPQSKQEWSEEDEKRVNRISDFIWKNRKGDTDEIYQQEQDVNWLKSLKSKKHWKPSEEQMQALFEAKLASTKNREYFLGLLYEDLKKLKLC